MKKLIEACRLMAVSLLEEFGEFYPFAYGLTKTNETINVATMTKSDNPESQEVIDELQKALAWSDRKNRFTAVCICVDIYYTIPSTNRRTDALQLRLNFKDHSPLDYILLYSVKEGKVLIEDSLSLPGNLYIEFS